MSKAKFLAFCHEQGLEVEHAKAGGYHHLHVYAPEGKLFAAHHIANVGLWDGIESPDWSYCLDEIRRTLPLIDDPEVNRV